MLFKWAVVLSALVAASLGSVLPAKRSDFSMFDNQFNRVGDTELDDEITDCALVEHQFRKGYIRLREYLERKKGCGRQGKLKNIEGIAKSTEDDINNDNIAEIAKSTTEDYHYTPAHVPAVKKAPKPKTIPQAIKIYQPNKMAYVPRRYPVPAAAAAAVAPLVPAKPVLQTTVQRNKAARPSLNDYQRESQKLALSFKNNPSLTVSPSSVESQSYQPQFTSALGDQYTRLASNDDQVTPPKPNHDLLQTFYPNTLQDRSHGPDAVAVGQPLYIQRARVQPVARTQNKVSSLLQNAMNNFNKVPASNPANTNRINGVSPKPQLYNKPATNLNVKSSPVENIDDAHADMRDPDKDDSTESIDEKPPQKPGIDDQPTGQATNINKPVLNTLNRFGKPVVTGNPTFVNRPQNALTQSIASPAAVDKVKPSQPSINLDVLKNKILHTTNATFLRRMLSLIQKITHHKDFHKLQAPARSFVAQANTAVQALNKAYNERVSSSPVTMGIDYPLTKKSAVQRFNQAYNVNQRMSAAPVNLGNLNQLYGNNYKKSTVQALNNQAYNQRIAASRANRFYGNNDYSVTKKFQIARNPYYQNYYQYRQPYYSNLQRMQYGLYNGNVP
ncbi:hypothetical protein ACROYT_G017135 [Oculina patagonica]